jgi:hypothetical protein
MKQKTRFSFGGSGFQNWRDGPDSNPRFRDWPVFKTQVNEMAGIE